MPPRPSAPQQTFISPDKYPYLEVRTTLQSTLPYAEHFHSAFSFGLILESGTCFTLMGQAHEALKGDIALIAPGLPHSCNPLHGKARSYLMAYFDAAWFARSICCPLGIAEAYEVTMPVVRDPALFQQGIAAMEAFCKGADDAEIRFAALFRQLQWEYGCLANSAEPVGKKMDYPLAAANILLPADIASMAGENGPPATDHAPVTSLARRAGLRRESFSRAFRRTAGLPPKAWLHCLRLEKARAMLRQGKSIADAALAAGYADQSHFHRMFVKFYSVTPGCYQRGRSHSYNTRKQK
ncbi:AraC family transcriptional regulator [Desulfovibrio desulfuricans]|uniref:AraC family transcriptional regulator n=1 Tax=Desulfovibrio desulfuricans TaxID=876 RepID=UPI0003B39AC9|nr:helix-turn-helix transcriptional regulator [Desulfovibrio desulfuricans]